MSRSPLRRGALSAVALFAALAVTACTAKGVDTLPPPPTTQPRPPTTTAVDYSGVDLKDVPGKTTTTMAMGPGGSTLHGIVVGPDGPVPGATVQAERLVGDAVGSVRVFTAEDGAWSITGIFGGRYRVRAWRPTDLALTKPDVFFLNDGDTKALQLRVDRFTGLSVSHAIAPNPPFVGEPANLVAQVVQQSVDEEGIVRGSPIIGIRVELAGSGEWSAQTSNPTVTNRDGRATWRLECRSEGKQPLSVIVANSEQFALDVPACVLPPEEPEPSTTTTTTKSGTSSTTSTTRRTTSTTRPDIND